MSRHDYWVGFWDAVCILSFVGLLALAFLRHSL